MHLKRKWGEMFTAGDLPSNVAQPKLTLGLNSNKNKRKRIYLLHDACFRSGLDQERCELDWLEILEGKVPDDRPHDPDDRIVL